MSQAPQHVVDRFRAIGPGSSVVTIGNFDGVHLGHQHLLACVTETAEKFNVRPVVVTFEPHPVSVLRPEQPMPRISLPSQKLAAMRAHGIDDVVVVQFDMEFASISATDFLDIVRLHTQPRSIIVGEAFRFGKDRSGDSDTIREYARAHGFNAEIIKRLETGELVVSSSRVRRAISNGEVRDATALLGRRFRLTGVVERGFARGRELGYPTANLMVVGELIIPASGIYAAYVHLLDSDEPPRDGLIYIGTSPTFEPRDRTVEAHILDFDGDLYARNIQIEFVSMLRGDQEFTSVEDLLEQIRQDEIRTREILANEPPESG